MPIPTEPVGSIPRSPELIAGMQQFAAGRLSRDQLARLQDEGVRDTIKRFEATESPVISDGEQSKPSFATYPIHGLASLARWRHHPVRRRTHAAAPPSDRGAVPLPNLRRFVCRGRAGPYPCASEAGGDRGLGPEP